MSNSSKLEPVSTLAIQNNIAKSVAFSGHRSSKMNNSQVEFAGMRISLRNTIVELCEQGYDTFYSGMAEGFDLLAAEEVICIRRDFPHIRLVAVIPYPAQARGFDAQTAQRYADVLASSDSRVILSGAYHATCFHKRNDYLVDHSSTLVCCYNGSGGGTKYTVNRACKSGHKVINLSARTECADQQLPLFCT